jgi:GGDEF domain-containing protein
MPADIWPEAYDSETGMANLSAFLEHVSHSMRRLDRSPLTLAVLSTHADQLVPETSGERTEAEHSLLVQTARRLRASIRPGDVVARIEESSFAVLCEDLASYDQAVGVALRLLDDLDEPLNVAGAPVRVNLRFGVAFPLADERSPRALLERSLEAMRAARVHPTRRYDVILGSATPDADAGTPSEILDLDALDRRLSGPDEENRGRRGERRDRVDTRGNTDNRHDDGQGATR